VFGRTRAGWCAIAAALVAVVGLSPIAHAEGQVGEVGTLYSPTPFVPDPGGFGNLLIDLSRAPGRDRHGMQTSNASLAVQTNSPDLAPRGTPGDLGLVTNPAMNAPISDLPAGNSLFNLVAPDRKDAGGIKVRDLGRLVVGHDGPVRRMERAVFGPGQYRDITLAGLGALVSAGLIARLGTNQAAALGVNPRLSFALLDGAFTQTAAFRCDPKLKNAGIELGSRYHLLHVESAKAARFLRDTFLEGGVTVQRSGEAGLIPNRYIKVHLANEHLDTSLSLWHPPAGHSIWGVETEAHPGAYRLRVNLTREEVTGTLGANTSLLRTRGSAMAGVYFGSRTSQGFSSGVLAMLLF
jgi:hypothetical protein